MSIKNISITVEAYKRLSNLKDNNESFSEVINRITKKNKFAEIHGILSGRANGIEKKLLKIRELHGKMHKKRDKLILKEIR